MGQVDQGALWILVSAVLVFLMQGGFLCLEVGLVRTRSATATAMKNVIDWTMVGLAFFLIGFGLLWGPDQGGFIGSGFFGLEGLEAGNFPGGPIFFLFQVGFAATAVTIVSGALAERTSFASYLLSSFFMGAIIYPVFGHWAWHESGWLSLLGFVDFAGSVVVHVLGGTVALVGAIVVGPRLSRFGADGKPVALESNSMPLAVLGTILLWVGWWGFNGGSVLAFDERVAKVLINTNLSAAAGALVGFLHGRFVQKSDVAPKLLGGLLGGLVAITAACHIVGPFAAIAIGATAGLVHNWVYQGLLRLQIDDAVGAVPVHLACGALGAVSVAVFGEGEALAGSRPLQFGIQLAGIAACIAWAGSTSYGVLVLLRATVGLRVSPAEERVGLSLDGAVIEFAGSDDEEVDAEALRELMGLGTDPHG